MNTKGQKNFHICIILVIWVIFSQCCRTTEKREAVGAMNDDSLKLNCDSLRSGEYISFGNCTCDSNDNCLCDSTGVILEGLQLCLNVDKKKWEDTLIKDPEVREQWRYFYDPDYYRIYKMGEKTPCDSIFLLEIRVNHGSGEYDNFIIRKTGKRFQVIQEFKGYFVQIIRTEKAYYDFEYSFSITPDINYVVRGFFNGCAIVTDTIISNNDIKMRYNSLFVKGETWR